MRNTPLHTKKARKGFQPLPGTQTTDHPQEQITPNKIHVKTSGK
jgi:hypothetical protein